MGCGVVRIPVKKGDHNTRCRPSSEHTRTFRGLEIFNRLLTLRLELFHASRVHAAVLLHCPRRVREAVEARR